MGEWACCKGPGTRARGGPSMPMVAGLHTLHSSHIVECCIRCVGANCSFTIAAKFVHDLSVSATEHGSVFMSGSGRDLNLDHHRLAPYANLYTNLTVGLGSRVFASGGNSAWGPHTAAGATFHNIRGAMRFALPGELHSELVPSRSYRNLYARISTRVCGGRRYPHSLTPRGRGRPLLDRPCRGLVTASVSSPHQHTTAALVVVPHCTRSPRVWSWSKHVGVGHGRPSRLPQPGLACRAASAATPYQFVRRDGAHTWLAQSSLKVQSARGCSCIKHGLSITPDTCLGILVALPLCIGAAQPTIPGMCLG